MLDWLKTILGEAYTEDVGKKVSAEIGKGFVSKADFNAKNEELKTAQGSLADANRTIEEFKGMDIDGIKKAADEWKTKAEQAERDAAAKVAEVEFNSKLTAAIAGAKGRSAKAVMALLDLDALKASKNQEADVKAALEGLKKENGYLFEDAQTPPPYAGGTGTHKLLGEVTKESFAKLGYRERLELKQSNPELYEQMKE